MANQLSVWPDGRTKYVQALMHDGFRDRSLLHEAEGMHTISKLF